MVRLQLLSGCRPGEVVALRPCDLTFGLDGTVCYRPDSHKTEHHGRERRIYLGPQAVAILRPFLERDPESSCFSPAESVAWHRNQHRVARKRHCGRATNDGTSRSGKPSHDGLPGRGFTTASYNRAIARGCEAAFAMPAELRNVNRKLPDEQRQALKRQAREWRTAELLVGEQVEARGGDAVAEAILASKPLNLHLAIAIRTPRRFTPNGISQRPQR